MRKSLSRHRDADRRPAFKPRNQRQPGYSQLKSLSS